MIRIAYIIGQLSHGGSERQLFELVVRLNKKKFEPVVICLSQSKKPYGFLLQKAGVEIYYLNRVSNFDIRRVFSIVKILLSERIDIVHSYLHIGNGYGVIASILAGKRDFIPSIRSEEDKRSFLIRITDWLSMKYAKKIIANSYRGRELIMDRWCVPADRVITIHNGVDFIRYFSNRNVCGKKEAGFKIVITMIGKPTYVKNIEMFLTVAEKVHSIKPDTCFRLVGPGLDDKFLESKSITSVFIEPLGSQLDIFSILRHTDIFILTSRSEGLPNVVLEALSMEIPVVATDVGGLREIINEGETGFLVPSGDGDRMVEKIISLIDNYEMRMKMGRNGAIHIKRNFSMEKMVALSETLYLSLA